MGWKYEAKTEMVAGRSRWWCGNKPN